MMEQILTASLSESAKLGAKVGSKVLCYVGGSLLGYGVSQLVMPKVKSSMQKYMESDKFKSLSPEDQQKEIQLYNVEAVALNGLCNAVGAVVATLVDSTACKEIDRSDFTIGSSFTI